MISIAIDHGVNRVIVTVPVDSRWANFTATVLDAIISTPVLAGYDWIIDDQGPMDDVDVAGMMKTGDAFRAAKRPDWLAHTVVVSRDRFFSNWALVMDEYHVERRHHSAPNLPQAIELLDLLTESRPSASPRKG